MMDGKVDVHVDDDDMLPHCGHRVDPLTHRREV